MTGSPSKRSAARRPTAPAATPESCPVCGSHEVAVDEVFERGVWLLSECRRCAQRWTEGPLAPAAAAA